MAQELAPYTENERAVIRAFAGGDKSRRMQAVSIFRYHLPSGVFRQDPYFEFMSEIDSQVPCYIVKSQSRAKILGRPWP